MNLEYNNREVKIKSIYGLNIDELKIIMDYIPKVENRLNYVFPGYYITSLVVQNSPLACGCYVKAYCVDGTNTIKIERDMSLNYEYGSVQDSELLRDLEERRKYLEGAYIFKDFPDQVFVEIEISFE